MKRIFVVVLAMVLAAGTVFVGAPAAYAEELTCDGSLGEVTVDNLVVPSGKACRLNGTVVEGNIVVNRNGRLNANAVSVNGSIQAEGAANVVVRGSSDINGDVQVKDGGRASVVQSRIGGTLLFDENEGALRAARNRISGDLQVFQNSGGVTLLNNRIDGNLQCKENNPAPTGGNNRADSKEDQCSNL